jgi:hypothetical protein
MLIFKWFTGYCFSVAFRYIWQFIALLDIKLYSFIPISTSFSHFISCHPSRLTPRDQVFNLSDHLLYSMRTTCPYHFNVFSTVNCITHFRLSEPLTSVRASVRFRRTQFEKRWFKACKHSLSRHIHIRLAETLRKSTFFRHGTARVPYCNESMIFLRSIKQV